MENRTFTVTLADGTQFSNLVMNGNYYVTSDEITKETFSGKLEKVTIADSEGNKEIYENVELIAVLPIDGGYGFALRKLTTEELEHEELLKTIEQQNAAIMELSELYASTLV